MYYSMQNSNIHILIKNNIKVPFQPNSELRSMVSHSEFKLTFTRSDPAGILYYPIETRSGTNTLA